jgi:hypothetical protein
MTKLTSVYNVKLLTKIKANFSDFEQQLFLSSFYCYLKYHPTNVFVIDLDDVWKWLGFSQKVNAKRILEKNFKINIDYKLSLCQLAKQPNHNKGGQNKEIFMLNIKTFRSLGLTTGTAIGIAVRESRVCQGYLWRYAGVSKEEQFNEQPVIKVCCLNGEKTCFKTIADAAKDCNISAPALRRRILTNVHINDHHWIFDKNASHYK